MIFVIIFIVAIITTFGILSYRVWEIKNGQEVVIREKLIVLPKKSLREIERTILLFLKHYIQKGLLFIAKQWFLITIKFKKWWTEKEPRIRSLFRKKEYNPDMPSKPSFISRALTESRYKIKRMKQKLHEEHDVEL